MIVYYGASDNNACPAPEPALAKLKEYGVPDYIMRCPAFTDFYRNVFLIYPTFDYSLSYDLETKSAFSTDYDQAFYDKMVFVRNAEYGDVTYKDPGMYMTTEAGSLVAELTPLPSYPFNSPDNIVPGAFDIAKHVRPLECAFMFNKSQSIVVKRAEPLYGVRFRTEEKIELKRFLVTDVFEQLTDSVLKVRTYTKNRKSLSYYYDLVRKNNIKNRLLKEIQNNLMD